MPGFQRIQPLTRTWLDNLLIGMLLSKRDGNGPVIGKSKFLVTFLRMIKAGRTGSVSLSFEIVFHLVVSVGTLESQSGAQKLVQAILFVDAFGAV
jgi:formate/nitrite transporter FocA (FNT family)